jgi:hypothetical protein
MLRALLSLLRRARGRSYHASRDRDQNRRIRALVIDAREKKLRTLAIAERVTAADLDDALDVLTQTYPITRDDAVLLIERHGLTLAHSLLALEAGDADA